MAESYTKVGNVTIREIKDTSEHHLNQLSRLRENLNQEGKEVNDRDIRNIKYGLLGEHELLFELKNSMIPLFIAENLYYEKYDLSEQIDFLVFTPTHCLLLEGKNAYGNIDVNNKSEFLRTYDVGQRKIKEVIYSPITQNKRNMDLLRMLRKERQKAFLKLVGDVIFDKTYKSFVLLANPKTLLDIRYAPK